MKNGWGITKSYLVGRNTFTIENEIRSLSKSKRHEISWKFHRYALSQFISFDREKSDRIHPHSETPCQVCVTPERFRCERFIEAGLGSTQTRVVGFNSAQHHADLIPHFEPRHRLSFNLYHNDSPLVAHSCEHMRKPIGFASNVANLDTMLEIRVLQKLLTPANFINFQHSSLKHRNFFKYSLMVVGQKCQ